MENLILIEPYQFFTSNCGESLFQQKTDEKEEHLFSVLNFLQQLHTFFFDKVLCLLSCMAYEFLYDANTHEINGFGSILIKFISLSDSLLDNIRLALRWAGLSSSNQ